MVGIPRIALTLIHPQTIMLTIIQHHLILTLPNINWLTMQISTWPFFLLNLGNASDPHTLVNSFASSTDNTLVIPTNATDLNLVPEDASQGSLNEEATPSYPLRRTLVDGTGPYITTGELRVQTDVSSDTESGFEMVRIFNLDQLNDGCPEWLRSDAWDVGQILENSNSLVQPIVNRVDRDRLRVETVNPSVGPSIKRVSEAGPSQTVSLDTSLNSLVDSKAHGLGPGPASPTSINFDPSYLSNLHCNDVLPETNDAARKRFGPDLGRLGRNIRQRLLCGFLQKEGTNYSSLPKSLSNSMPYVIPVNEMLLEYPNGCWEVGPKQLPQQP